MTNPEEVDPEPPFPGKDLLQVILAIIKSDRVTWVGVHELDFKEILAVLLYDSDKPDLKLEGITIIPDSSNRGELSVHVNHNVSRVIVRDVWAILHPETATRFHRVLWDEVVEDDHSSSNN
jgi:hypothetical protein